MATGLFVLLFSIKLVAGQHEGFIVGGDYTQSVREFPHVAFLSLLHASNSEYTVCGSSILNQMILITAAHCMDDIDEVTAYVGHLIREQGKLYRVAGFEQHENWYRPIPTYDIALCRLKKHLSLGQAVKRVVLMRRPLKVHVAEVAGWGAIEETNFQQTSHLKHTKQKLWTHDQCKRIVYNLPIGTICGGEAHAREDFASSGDSGSGLIVQKKLLVGVVSYKNANVSHSLVVYTDIVHYYDWIARESKRLACS